MSTWVEKADGFLYGAYSLARRTLFDLVTWRRRRRWDRAAAPLREHAKDLVPKDTDYCYADDCCVFWDRADDLPEHSSGYCSLLRKRDWEHPGGGLLWDQCKECGINERDYQHRPDPRQPPPPG